MLKEIFLNIKKEVTSKPLYSSLFLKEYVYFISLFFSLSCTFLAGRTKIFNCSDNNDLVGKKRKRFQNRMDTYWIFYSLEFCDLLHDNVHQNLLLESCSKARQC